MDERFGEWLRDAMADIDDELLKRRWAGVESLAADLECSEVLDLLLCSTNCRIQNADTIEKVRRAFWEHDKAFRMTGNDLEIRRLCGAIVIRVLNSDTDGKLAIALACACLNFGGSYGDFGLSAMSDEAECTLQGLSAAIRSKDTMEKQFPARVMVPTKILARVKQLSEEGHDHVPIQELHDVLIQFGRGINQVTRDNRLLQDALTIQREETDILWWLTGACSNDMNQPFAHMDAAVSAIIAGKELADHVVQRPGPLSVANILNRVIEKCGNPNVARSIGTLVTEVPMDWKRELSDSAFEGALPYCPLHAAISHSVTVDNDPSWVTPFARHFRHCPSVELSPSVLSLQMYRERMLSIELCDWR